MGDNFNLMKCDQELPQNPFYHRISPTRSEKIQICAWGLLLLPIRLALISILFGLTWICGATATCFMTFEENQKYHFSWWRRILRFILSRILIRGMFFVSGFYWVKIEGRKANFDQAPIIIAGCHSSYCDVLVQALLGAPSIVAKSELRPIPFYGSLLAISQAICVSRSDEKSRQSAMNEIRNRVQNGINKNQIYMYPEGTCTNRCGLLKFKPGAFSPGVPVQPLLIKYSSYFSFDSTTWTFLGPHAFLTLLINLCTPINYIELKFLPVYIPSNEEKMNPHLYGENVRTIMAKGLDLPLIDQTGSDGLNFIKMKKSKIYQKLEKICPIRKSLNFDKSELKVEFNFLRNNYKNGNKEWRISKHQFEQVYGDFDLRKISSIYKIFDEENKGYIDMREVIYYMFLLQKGSNLTQLVEILFTIYANFKEEIYDQDLLWMMTILFDMDCKEVKEICTKKIEIDEFKNTVIKRLGYAKLLALEIRGDITNFPITDRK